MSKIEITRTELVWPGKYDDEGQLVSPRRVSLPFQVIERVNETRATREQREEERAGHVATLFDYWQADEQQMADPGDGWRNKLIWGDNLYVMGSLLEHFAGKIDLIYIDPPFATGADFSFKAMLGETDVLKDQSIIEEKAYRDTWGHGLDSYLRMLHERLVLMRELLSDTGTFFLHVGENISHYVRALADEVFGSSYYVNEIVWKRSDAHSDVGQGATHLGRTRDSILFYSKGQAYTLNPYYTPLPASTVAKWYRHEEPETRRRYNKADITGPGGAAKGNPVFEWHGITRAWRFSKEKMEQLEREGRLIYSQSGMVYLKRYLDESKGIPPQDWWDDIPMVRGLHKEYLGYPTQKPEALVERILGLCSDQGDLIADFFSGSGTTLAVAERMGRRWLGSDLSRYAVHTTRKRMLNRPDCRPFEILNLGQYERQVWQGVTFGGQKQPQQMLIFEYLKFILDLYGAQPLAGTQHIHGKKGGRWCTSAPSTRR